jgi:hypothetical protein
MTDEYCAAKTVSEFGQHLGKFRMDRRAVVALHEVLDDELLIGAYVVGDASTDLKIFDGVMLDRFDVTEPRPHRPHHGLLE